MIYKHEKRNQPLALIVDDEPTIRLIMGAALRKSGLNVVEAETGSQGIELFESEIPDVILLDVMLPDMDGFEVCRCIRGYPEGTFTQILMVTGLEDLQSIKKAFEVGANSFIGKPLNLNTLGQQIHYMLRAGQAFKELHVSKSRLAKTQELARIGNWQVDLRTGDFLCSPEACRLLALDISNPYIPGGEILDESFKNSEISFDDFFSSIVHQDRKRIKEKVEQMLDSRLPVTLEYRINNPDGSQKHILNRSEIIFDEQENPVLLLGIVQDVSQLKQAEEEIRFLAFYDGLTGLANRMLFMDRLDYAISEALRSKKMFALLFLDLDHFKRVNDTLGHHTGDLLLQAVAKNIKNSIRKNDTATRVFEDPGKDALVARLGGDEFCILLTGLRNPEGAALVARRLLEKIPVNYDFDGNEVSITTSIGISVFPEDGNNSEILLKHADTAMYHAKNNGRNTYQFFKDSMNLAAVERFTMDQDLKKALKNDEFALFYQPKLRLSDRKIIGAEALIRWYHPQKGMIPPDKFISIAEESDIIIDINYWVFKTACNQICQWIDRGFEDMTIAINISGYKFNSQDLIRYFKEGIDAMDLDAGNIEIEITESILMQDTAATISTLNSIKGMNFRIALDDFGTGYSSLSYLTSFPVDTLKIDRSFVMGSMSQKNNLLIIKAIIAMGHSLGKKIVAEGIETEEQYDFLREFGCDEGQGYFFHHPVPSEEFEKLLARGYL